MRMRRRFQPMLDSMPSRIAPSAVGGLISPAVLLAGTTPLHSPQTGCQPEDTDMPQVGNPTPIIPPK
jgi:hypothetical protein